MIFDLNSSISQIESIYDRINKNMPVMKKKFIYPLIALAVLPVMAFAGLRILIRVSYSENDIKVKVTDFFKKEMRKAVKFESLSVGLLGDVTVRHFNMSMTNDFNDNLSLVKSEKVRIDLRILPMLSGKFSIRGIDFHNADILLYKRYGMTYREFADQFGVFRKFAEKNGGNNGGPSNSLRVRFIESRLQYKEMFKEKKTEVSAGDVEAAIQLDSGNLVFKVFGTVVPSGDRSGKNGLFLATGEGRLDNSKIRSTVVLEGVDLTLANNFIEEYGLTDLELRGYGDMRAEYSSSAGSGWFRGKIEADSVELSNRRPGKYTVLMNDNIDIELDAEFDANGLFRIRKARIFDDCVDVALAGEFKGDELFALRYMTNEIDLEKLTTYFTPVKDYTLAGTFHSEGAIRFSRAAGKVEKSDISVSLQNMALYRHVKGVKIREVGEGFFSFASGGGRISISCAGTIGATDLQLAVKSHIGKWFPLQSDSYISMNSSTADALSALRALGIAVDSLYEAAYDDQRKGYDQEFFLQSAAGKLLNSNNAQFHGTVRRVMLGDGLGLDDLYLSLSLENGSLTSRDFGLRGHGAEYSFNILGNLRTEQPYLKVSADVRGFRIDDPPLPKQRKGLYRGVISGGLEYELSFYRLSHIIENSKGRFSLQISDGGIRGSKILRDLKEYLGTRGYAFPDRGIVLDKVDLNMALLADNYYITGSTVQSVDINAAVYGKYTVSDGFDVTAQTMLKDGEGVMKQVPMHISGPLARPCLRLKQGKEDNPFCAE